MPSNLKPRCTYVAIVANALFGVIACNAQQIAGCGSLTNAFGPFDYMDPDTKNSLTMVEDFHFTPDVEALRKGKSGAIIGDLDYTLRAFPNHHRALNSLANYSLRGGRVWPNPSVPSAECYFKRAMAFRPDDSTVRMLYANYLTKRGDRSAARTQYEEALRISGDSPEINYNAGLFFLAVGDLERAKRHASVAYAGGYPLPGLKKKIAQAEAHAKPVSTRN